MWFYFLFYISVYCACCLGNHDMRGLVNQEVTPHFYINIADIEALETEVAYIACKYVFFSFLTP